MFDTNMPEQLLVVASRVLQFRGRRNDADPGFLAATDVDKAVEYFRVMEFLFGATDRDDVPAIRVIIILLLLIFNDLRPPGFPGP